MPQILQSGLEMPRVRGSPQRERSSSDLISTEPPGQPPILCERLVRVIAGARQSLPVDGNGGFVLPALAPE